MELPSLNPAHSLREDCPVERASLVLHLKDGRRLEYTVTEPDAARLLVDFAVDRHEDVLYGDLPITPDPLVVEPRLPTQFTVTFGFRLGRRDKFLTRAQTPPDEREAEKR